MASVGFNMSIEAVEESPAKCEKIILYLFTLQGSYIVWKSRGMISVFF